MQGAITAIVVGSKGIATWPSADTMSEALVTERLRLPRWQDDDVELLESAGAPSAA